MNPSLANPSLIFLGSAANSLCSSSSDWIHDSFGCHPNHVDLMLEITKIEFKKLVRRKPLYLLDKELRSQADQTKLTQKMLAEVSVPSLRGFDISKGDLDVVMNSNWFFS